MTEYFRCPPDHGHAVNTTCYVTHRCRCFACRLDNAQRTSQYARPTDLPYSLAPEPVAAHVAHLKAFGYTYRQMALAAGVNEGTPYRLAHGRLKFVHGRVGRALLAVKPDIADLDPCTIIPARGMRRRIHALATVGWSLAALAPHTGMTRERLSQSFSQERVTVRTHQRVADAYELLWDALPPSSNRWEVRTVVRTKNRAASLGWAPPLAWDDIDNDPAPQQPEPTNEIDVIKIELVVSDGVRVDLTQAERREAVSQLNRGRRLNDAAIAMMLGVSEKTVFLDRKALGIPAAVGYDNMPLPRSVAA